MDRALGLLLLLRLNGWLRRFLRSMSTLKGVMLTLMGLVLFVPWLLSVFIQQHARGMHLSSVRRSGPLALAAYCLATLLLSSSERAIYFSPAEVNLLFPGPFSRRQLLGYKVAASAGLCAISAVFMSLVMRQNAAWGVAAYVGMFLGLMFVQLFAMAVALVNAYIGELASSRRRRVVLAVVALVLGLALVQVGGEALAHPSLALLVQLEQSPAVQTVLTPLRWFVLAFTAERLWPDLVQWAALGLAVNAVLVLIVLVLDAQYLEAAAAASARIYSRIEAMRRGRSVPMPARAGSPRFTLPSLPWWGGAGPSAWRQLVTATRDLRRLLGVVIICGVMVVPSLISAFEPRHATADAEALPRVLSGVALAMSLIISQIVTFDFRGDVDRIDVLKTLPVAPAALVLGQLAAPVVLLTGVQWATIAGIAATSDDPGWFVPLAAFAIPFNTLLCGLENLLFLWFPVRTTTSNPADIQNTGRMLLLMCGKVIGLGVSGGVAVAVAGLTYFLSNHNWTATLVAAWLTLLAMALAHVPLIAHAFRQFDVARDTPA